ncbi:MAG: ABC transporter permease [Paucibacter sp.]|nr:ABC transporter permease [Roseateles sp.]
MQASAESPPTLIRDANTTRLAGAWTLLYLRERFDELGMQAAAARDAAWDLSEVQRLDHAGALMLWQAWGGKRPEQLHWRPEHEALFSGMDTPAPPRPRRRLARESVQPLLLGFASHMVDATTLLGRIVLDLMLIARRPQLIAWRDISAQIYRSGAQALGITALVGFLVGITLSYLTSRQLKSYGADIFVVNILGLSVWRELGPLLAAILLAGRSGSAMTAQLGVMRVTQELDALSVMGISHTVRLVIPRMLALGLSMPLVVVWTSSLILFGGMIAASAILGLDYVQFLRGVPAAVPIANLWLGLAKSVVFGLLIAFTACHYGLRIKPNSVSLGAGTTDSVVASITMVIIVDAIFAVVFSDVGL